MKKSKIDAVYSRVVEIGSVEFESTVFVLDTSSRDKDGMGGGGFRCGSALSNGDRRRQKERKSTQSN